MSAVEFGGEYSSTYELPVGQGDAATDGAALAVATAGAAQAAPFTTVRRLRLFRLLSSGDSVTAYPLAQGLQRADRG